MIVTSPVKTEKSRRQYVDYPPQGYMRPVTEIPLEKEGGKTTVSPWKIMLASLVIGVLGYTYISHVFTTQTVLREVNLLHREFDAVNRLYEDRSLTYDRMTGPAEVYRRATSMGMIHGGAKDPVIIRNR